LSVRVLHMCGGGGVSNHHRVLAFLAHVSCQSVHDSGAEIVSRECLDIEQGVHLVGSLMCYNYDALGHSILQRSLDCARVDRNYAESVYALSDHIVDNLYLRSSVSVRRS